MQIDKNDYSETLQFSEDIPNDNWRLLLEEAEKEEKAAKRKKKKK
jgi:ATP-dependent RNA helicase RhlE